MLTLLPLVLTLPFSYYLLTSRPSIKLLSLLSITSLLSTSYTMWFIPVSPNRAPLSLFKTKRPAKPAFLPIEDNGPIEQALPYLNLGICALLCLAAAGLKGKKSQAWPEEFWVFLLLPTVMLGMVWVGKKWMTDVQQGIGELQGMRYGYKGA